MQQIEKQRTENQAKVLLCHLAHWNNAPEAGLPTTVLGAEHRMGYTSLGELLAYIDARLSMKPCLDELANRAAFTRSFKASVGMSPHHYLDVRRVEAAKKMLQEPDLDLAYIAQETGFSSHSHFTANFHSLVGCTPARFRVSG